MINIIPKPYSLLDNEKRYLIDGFKYNCPINLEDGLSLFKQENKDGNYLINVEYKEFNNSEAYSLNVTKKGVTIEASSSRALFYATRSLTQIIEYKKDKIYTAIVVLKNDGKTITGNLLLEPTYGWSAEDILLDVFTTPSTRNYYLSQRISRMLELIADRQNESEEYYQLSRQVIPFYDVLKDTDPLKDIIALLKDK